MTITIIIITSIIVVGFIFRGYIPVLGLRCSNWSELETESIKVIDLRDYNESYKDPIPVATNIPIAYLNRYYIEIPNNELHVVAPNHFDKNIGVRFLRKKGFQVVGYTIIDHDKIYLEGNQIKQETYC
jgi:rhodanese-related sulfurtransferase